MKLRDEVAKDCFAAMCGKSIDDVGHVPNPGELARKAILYADTFVQELARNKYDRHPIKR